MKQIDLTGSVLISKSAPVVFDYLSNYSNDPFWRAEINASEMSTPTMEKGTVITEESMLSRKVPRSVALLKCIEFNEGSLVVCEATDESKFWQKSTRQVESVSDNVSRVTYRMQFDQAIVKHGLGFNLPAFLVRFYTKKTMNKYLEVFKRTLEKRPDQPAFVS